MRILTIEKNDVDEIAKRLRLETIQQLPIGEVYTIIEEVRRRGDKALLEFEEKFDGVKLSKNDLKVKEHEILEAYENTPREVIDSIKVIVERLESFESKRLAEILKCQVRVIEDDGVTITYETIPLDRVGVYVPGGRAYYPSSLIMSIVPAKIAGVKSIAITTPPNREGKIDPVVLATCYLLGVDEIYKVGGAQAIAALAYGTETIKPVDMIVGAGGRYVTAAKHIVSTFKPIEFLAGPTELVVLADGTANPKFIAYDLASQAEHGDDSIVILATDSKELASRVIEVLKDKDVKTLNMLTVVIGELKLLVDFVNTFSPEHVQVVGEEAEKYTNNIKKAGLVLIGEYTPTAASDYVLGTNHILPTYGLSSGKSGLSPLNFLKTIVKVKATKDGLFKLKDYGICLAIKENLLKHVEALEVRFYEH